MRTREEILHPGELLAQARFEERPVWPQESLNRLMRRELDEEMRWFIQDQGFFFLSTADDQGNCDCSFKGSERNADGSQQPVARVLDSRTLVFPDFAGNKLYNSLGNLLRNPRLGLLFISFPTQSRLRVNGGAEILEDAGLYAETWPRARRFVRVSVEQAYWNCAKRIPASI